MVAFRLSGGNVPDAVEGWLLMESIGNMKTTGHGLGHGRWGVPPKRSRIHPWEYDREVYKRRNEIERFFRRLKRFRGICTRYDKLERMLTAFIYKNGLYLYHFA
jgi:hypothetical protein